MGRQGKAEPDTCCAPLLHRGCASVSPRGEKELLMDRSDPDFAIHRGVDTDEKSRQRGLHLLTYSEMEAMPEPEWLVEGIIQKRSAVVMFGKSNAFKSFLAIDIGLSVEAGID